jgi:hypothetical protein
MKNLDKNTKAFSLLFFLSLVAMFSCKKYLEAKPNKALVTPATLADLKALLDNNSALNLFQFPALSEVASDDYWVSYANLSSRPDFFQKHYIWNDAASALPQNDWFYGPVFIANTVLDEWPGVIKSSGITVEANAIKGDALFRRGFSFYLFAQTYCKPYIPSENNSDPGIPLRLSSNFNTPSTRGTVRQTYDQIISDFKTASNLLPIASDYKTRPNKVAALAALARTYLVMEDYSNAGLYADSALQLNNTLMDYNSLNPGAPNPFVQFNAETIFFAWAYVTNLLSPSRANVDSTLYESYADDDLRKTIFFQNNGNGNHGFKGSYAGELGGTYFTGLATDELYLIRAECYARNDKKDAAMTDLNALLAKRWKTGTFVPFTASNSEQALFQIIKERRKELIMRGVRWSDLRRLNQDPRFAKTLRRVITNGGEIKTYTLPPNDLRYVLLIPAEVIALSGMQQNPR